MHVDFQRIDETTKLRKKVPLHFEGEENSPAVKTDKCLITHVRTDLEIECLAAQLPEFVTDRPVGLVKGTSAARQRPQAPRGHQGRQARHAQPGDRGRTLPKAEEEVEVAPTRGGAGREGRKAKPKKDERQNKK